ncbi:protein kinase [Aetokthonos hydrillicola Thurmond2011]|jgi:serine/threonine-protein kinase|uniref:non-specific serine/threonine protein kinase n=1 Tax=Aetokthonos hydrillicola Thurmond2011 TaxID=2712845 RepID=A0AAP5I5E0_9CYAN|nr:protein kinase [Aetokthonos hydrillicola]MBO3459803.1 protein kinase [Aetokthonos hydrillicola CCALA 1050]MBW4584552.1 protein kinase [Aetokthonos hydrillicola CCALA 1050]MDR9895096.1 protein kinase [Aetokthonos hydrillicola Thurmond2011]
MIGKLLDHRYQVLRVLATGGFGQTYIAQDTKRPGNPICVVKHLKPANSEPKVFDTAKRLFRSEAETLEKLGHHDQIPRLLAYFDENQEFYLVQEFIEGHALSDELVSDQRWSEGQVIHLLQEVLAILIFVHNQGVIHRDIKPDNIIRRASDKKLVLVDFGAVKQLRASYIQTSPTLVFTGAVNPSVTVAIGTPGYMSTEQGQGKPRPNSDIYALGIIAIQALTGVPPMDLQEDPQTGEILWQQMVSVSDEFAAVLTKMIRYHFKDRYQSASQVLQALESVSPVSESDEYPKHSGYQLTQFKSPQSRQKTIALAPAYPEAPAAAIAEPVHKSSGKLDLLQVLILIGLAASAAVISPIVVKNVQNVVADMTGNNFSAGQNCVAVVAGNSNMRSEPSSISSNTIVKTLKNDTKFEVTGRRTQHGWVEVKFDPKRNAWAHSDVIKNNEEWPSCLRDKGIAMKTLDDNDLITTHAIAKGKSKLKTRSQESAQISPSASEKSQPKKEDAQALAQARKKYDSGDLQGAIALVQSLTSNPSAAKETAEMVAHWQQDWAKAEAVFNDINTAISQRQWDKVLVYKDHHEKLPNIQYWRDKLEPLIKQATENVAKQQVIQGAGSSPFGEVKSQKSKVKN